MNLLRIRMHHLIEQLADEDLYTVWQTVQGLYFDSYMLRAIEEVKRSQQPWDMLTHDEALKQLMFL
jgi:hypothetical protein